LWRELSCLMDIKNYFELFNLPVAFSLDEKALRERYLILQRVVHPDRFVNKSEPEKKSALQESARINTAFHVLMSPVERALYLLSLAGVNDVEATTMDPSFLQQQMIWRERIEQKDESVYQAIKEKREALLQEITVLFDRGDEKNLQRAKGKTQELQFILRLL
jgi:molecular chaperone HscB